MWPVTLEEMLCHCGLHLVPTGLGWLEKPANIPAETSVHFREILELKIILNMNFKKVTLRYSNASGWKMNFHLQLDGNFIFSSCARYSTMIFFTSISPFYIFHLYLEASSINPWILWPFHPHLSLLAQAAVAEVVVHRGGGKLGGPWWNFMEIPHVKIWEIPRF